MGTNGEIGERENRMENEYSQVDSLTQDKEKVAKF